MPRRFQEQTPLDLMRMFMMLKQSTVRVQNLEAGHPASDPWLDNEQMLLCNCQPRTDTSVQYREARQLRYAMQYMLDIGQGKRKPPTLRDWRKFAELFESKVKDSFDVDEDEVISDMDGEDSDGEKDDDDEEEASGTGEAAEDEAAAEDEEAAEEGADDDDDDADDAEYLPAEEEEEDDEDADEAGEEEEEEPAGEEAADDEEAGEEEAGEEEAGEEEAGEPDDEDDKPAKKRRQK